MLIIIRLRLLIIIIIIFSFSSQQSSPLLPLKKIITIMMCSTMLHALRDLIKKPTKGHKMIGPTRSVVTVERGHSERGHHVARLDPSSTEVRPLLLPACEVKLGLGCGSLPVSSGFLEANFVVTMGWLAGPQRWGMLQKFKLFG